MLIACSAKKNTRATRNFHALTTRYNIYYNAKTNYDTQLETMQSGYVDNYTKLIFLDPVGAFSHPKEPQPTGSYTRTIEKCQKAIRTHSISTKPKRDPNKMHDPTYKAWVQREEFNPFMHHAWLLMGKAQFYSGDFLAAATTFTYTTRHFSWLPEVITASRIWQARCYVELGWNYEAEEAIRKATIDSIPPRLQPLLALTKASHHMLNKDYEQAIPELKVAIKGEKEKAQRARLTFALAQMYALTDNNEMAYKSYSDVISMNPSFHSAFNARIRRTEVYAGEGDTKIEKQLKKMARDSKNKEYLDQVYYALGNVYLNRQDTVQAVDNYLQATTKSTRNGIDKAFCDLKLGDIYFDQRLYTKAQPHYAAALPLLDKDFPNFKGIEKRSAVLDELSEFALNVELQDSLQELAAMPEEERNAALQRIIDAIIAEEKAAADAMKMEEQLAMQQEAANKLNKGNAQQPTTPAVNTNGDTSWYFYNNSLVAAGKTSFQSTWGSRKLEDDWRRRNKTGFSMSDFEETNYDELAESDEFVDEELLAETAPNDSLQSEPQDTVCTDPKQLEFYIQQLPFTEEDIANSNEIIVDGLFNMGLILKNSLEDREAAMAAFDRLIDQYTGNKYLLEVYYNIYLMSMIGDDIATADSYKARIIEEFPSSDYAIAMAQPDYLENLRTMDSVQDSLYIETYNAYIDGKNSEVHAQYNYIKYTYPLSRLMPKFMFLDALAYVNERQYDLFKERLKELLGKYPESDVSPLSSSMLKGVAQGREIVEKSGSVKGMLWSTRLSKNPSDTTATGEPIESEAPAFIHNPNEPHLLVLVFPTEQVVANRLLFDVAKYNFSNFMVKDFELEIISFNEITMLVIKGFTNFDELMQYRSLIQQPDGITLDPAVRPIMISTSNFKSLLEGHSFEEYFEFQQTQTDYDEK